MNLDLTAAIDAAYAAAPEEPARQYIGASGVGSQCDAELMLSLRGFPNNPVPPRLRRIFNDGHRLEPVIVADLKLAGYDVRDRADDGKQFGATLYGGHVRCHCDGFLFHDGERAALLEIKTLGDAPFKAFVSRGIRISHPHYWLQVQMMLMMFRVERGVLLARNKNTAAYHHEWVMPDMIATAAMTARMHDIVIENKGRRVARSRSDHRCKSCFKHDACWQKTMAPVACSTCRHGRPSLASEDDRAWLCSEGHTFGVPLKDDCSHFKRYVPDERK